MEAVQTRAADAITAVQTTAAAGGQGRSGGDCGCDNDRQEDEGCGCRNDFRSEPRFEQRPFSFNANQVCGCEEPSNNNCDR